MSVNLLSVQKAGLEMLNPCTEEPLTMWSQVEQHLLSFAALEVREDKQGRSTKNSGFVYVKRDGEDITWDDLLYKLLINCLD
jgi:hypothetical protein